MASPYSDASSNFFATGGSDMNDDDLVSSVTYENVGYAEWQVTGGRMLLARKGFMYVPPLGLSDSVSSTMGSKKMVKLKWSSVAKHSINPPSHEKCLLKVTTKSGEEHVFEMEDRKTLDDIRVQMHLGMEAIQEHNKSADNHIITDDDTDAGGVNIRRSSSAGGSRTQYTNVGFQGLHGGRFVLTSQGMTYLCDADRNKPTPTTLHWKWQAVAKCKINPASHETPLLRMVVVVDDGDSGGAKDFSRTFQMKDRMDLERIKADIQQRRQTRLLKSLGSEERLEDGPLAAGISLRKSHGGNQKHHAPVKSTLGSFGRIVGPAADIKELEYLSSLHQNASKGLRMDGTISSKDIKPYLSSRYGIHITDEQGEDIARNLCGGKHRGEFAAKMDALRRELNGDEEDEEEDEDDDEVDEGYLFDLVQVMSLLMVPEICQMANQHAAKAPATRKSSKKAPQKSTDHAGADWADLSQPVNFLSEDKTKRNVPAQVSPRALAILKVVIESLIEIFDEELQRDIRNGLPLDADMMRTILESFADVDTANDPVLIEQMLDALSKNGGSPTLTVENFVHALSADVKDFPVETIRKGEQEAAKTSMFFDIFKLNWDEDTEELTKLEKFEAKKTASFIDYGADTYRSSLHNTSVWVLFILTTLIYLNFFLTLLRTATGGLFCPDVQSYACAVGNKVVGWILTALFCGLYGLFFIIPTSLGNVAGRQGLLFFTLMVTLVFAYAPFSTLILYKKGIPHKVTTELDHRVVCPAWIDPDFVEAALANGELEDGYEGDDDDDDDDFFDDFTKIYLRFDSTCHPMVEWCGEHPEVQGKYLDPDPDYLTYGEFEVCLNFMEGYALSFEFWEKTGGSCDPSDDSFVCPGGGPCALSDLTEEASHICCHSGIAANIPITNTTSYPVCGNQPLGAQCREEAMCESGSCVGNICVRRNENATAVGTQANELGAYCGRSNEACTSGLCLNGTCQLHAQYCPAANLGFLGGYRLDPFCRTVDDWCKINDYNLLGSIFIGDDATSGGGGDDAFGLGSDDFLTHACENVLIAFVEVTQSLGIELTKIIDVSEAREVTIAELHHINYVEDALMDPWTYFILICIAIVGAFAVVAILSGFVTNTGESRKERLRDYGIKCAASHKMADVIENALNMHMLEGASTKGQVMRNFFLYGEKIVEVGGVVWTFTQIKSGRLFSEEGVRYTGRMWIGQITQLLVTIVGIAYGSRMIQMVGELLDEIRSDLSLSYSPEQIKDLSPYEWATITREDLTISSYEQTILDWLPEKWMVDGKPLCENFERVWFVHVSHVTFLFGAPVAGITAVVVASLVAFFCMSVYVPSYTNTVLKLRNGMIPSLRDPYFSSYRNSADNVIQNIGNMVFSLMGAGVFTAVLVFLLVFAFCYPKTRVYYISYGATAIGIGCTMTIKTVGQKLLRGRNWSSFYRRRPGSANYWNLFFECWYLGTGLLVVITRLIMFLVTGALWLGRTDVEFLNENVKILGTGMDKVPTGFKRDLLVHEAHLHPFIERLGAMYLMRLKHGDEFGTVAGTAWRCLFVSGLMPWTVKLRVNASDDADIF